MARRRAKKTGKQVVVEEDDGNKNNGDDVSDKEKKEEIPKEDASAGFLYQEVERQSAAVRAIRDVEIEHSLTALRLLRSYFNEEQLCTPVLQFFKENLPNLSLLKNEENGQIEVKWDDRDGNFADGTDVHASLLRRLSIGFSHYYNRSSLGSFDLSDTVRMNLLGADSLHFKDLGLQGPSDSQILGTHDALRTPGVSSHRLSIGMTPKTGRLPKPGEMLLSVHGSPLGVYKEDNNMGAINEEEG